MRDRSAVTLRKKHVAQYDFEFQKIARADRSMSVLEIGCGTGLFLRYLEHKGYARVVAVDSDPHLGEVLGDLKVAQVHFGDVFALAEQHFPTERFDRIALYDVIEHIEVEHLFPFMRRLHDLLAPGGKVVLRAPNVTSPWGVKLFFDTFDHVTPITPGRVRELAAGSGFTVESLHEQKPAKWGRRLLQDAVHGFLNATISYRPDIWSANLLAVLARAP